MHIVHSKTSTCRSRAGRNGMHGNGALCLEADVEMMKQKDDSPIDDIASWPRISAGRES